MFGVNKQTVRRRCRAAIRRQIAVCKAKPGTTTVITTKNAR
ncbi:hypothetical protein Acaty_m0160 (plasmid) [Acidithiobacillus caldus ATCC 51756]|uniref:Uncharacterized protein n=1 Tax=Acidithiobacillus caldus (strain ATCC 51756 / DSM 8584 / KU) TaxID=637389 RepID=A0A059ZZ60_ACICK|nr:hypothetical protein Acaty_m0160 [Acidithiobacillus caldus ATCC 51756]